MKICIAVDISCEHLNKLLKADKLSSRNIAKLTATNNQSERVKEEPNKLSNKRPFNINSSTNENSETDQSPAKVSKMQEIGKMLLIRPSSNKNRQNRINQKTNSPPNTEVSSSSDRPEVISGKEKNLFSSYWEMLRLRKYLFYYKIELKIQIVNKVHTSSSSNSNNRLLIDFKNNSISNNQIKRFVLKNKNFKQIQFQIFFQTRLHSSKISKRKVQMSLIHQLFMVSIRVMLT